MPANSFGERIARTYEAKWPELFDPAVIEPVVRFLADLAGTGAALELGVGTGRIALRAALEPAAGGRARVVLEDAGVYGIVVLRPGGAAR